MPKAKLHPAFEEFHGSLGSMTFSRGRNGETIVRQKPRTPETWTARQQEHRSGFQAAVAYANRAKVDPALRAIYEPVARAKGLGTYHLALADYCHPPRIGEIALPSCTGKAGDTVRIEAQDDFAVATVAVVIKDLTGRVLEQGAAVLGDPGGPWTYQLQAGIPAGLTVQVCATATDHAGHTVSKSAFWAQSQPGP